MTPLLSFPLHQRIPKFFYRLPRYLLQRPSRNSGVSKSVCGKKLALENTAQSNPAGTPAWYNPHPGTELKKALAGEQPVYLYIPWIAEHGDSLIAKIQGGPAYALAPLDYVDKISDNDVRKEVARFARTQPDQYKKLIIRRLVPLKNKTRAVIFTFDWSPVMRIIAEVCEDLDIRRILIPHESVFVDREKYYWDPTARASVPVADVILGWGNLQKDIFTERGYPARRFHAVGAPKFDMYHNYQAQLSKKQFCRIFSLDADKPVILFASQPLDSQIDTKVARESQRTAINDLLRLTAELNMQLLVRLPPSKDDIIGPKLREKIADLKHAAIDDATCYLVTPEEAMHHSSLIASINSTMLFEGILLGKPACSMRYVQFDSIWDNVEIPAVCNFSELKKWVPDLINGKKAAFTEKGMNWARINLSCGDFDGKAIARIKHFLEHSLAGEDVDIRSRAAERILGYGQNDCKIDVACIPSSGKILDTTQKYFRQMVQARTLLSSSHEGFDPSKLASVDVFFQWGITPNENKNKQTVIARRLGKKVLIAEDGFIRSVNIGLSEEPALSIILDELTAYYDATQPSSLEAMLQSGPALNELQRTRCISTIKKITGARISKYNHAPDIQLKLGHPERKKVLVIDQRFGDQSIESGLADEDTFVKMLESVINDYEGWDIIIKQHPDAIKGGKSSYFSNERMAAFSHIKTLHFINYDVNPHALFDLVEEVHVCTSGVGMEALMAGKKVHCHGAPFYSGWGLTADKIKIPRRDRQRTVEEIFYYAYIHFSRYFRPDWNKACEIEDVVDYIAAKK